MTTTPEIEDLRRRMHAAQDAWNALRGHGNTPELIAAAKIIGRLEGEYRLAKQGRFRRQIPAGSVECDRCGGYGGHHQWPGFVCFKCDGRGFVDAS